MTIRPMIMSDADKMLEWKNDDDTRKFSIYSKNKISKEDHYKWLEKNIQYFHVIEGFDKLIGAFRIDNYEISIWIDKQFRGSGIASWVLEEYSEKGMKAKIVDGNIASMRCFINAGFKPVVYNDGIYIFER